MAHDDHYQALELPPDATADDIKDAWRRIAKASHPDRNPDDEAAVARFVRASEAYEVLGDPARRARYDQSVVAAARLRTRPVRPWNEDIVWAPQGMQRRGGRRPVHAPPPSDRDVQAVRSGTRSDGTALMVVVGMLGVGPIVLMLAVALATIVGGPLFVVLLAGLLLIGLVLRRRGAPP